MPKKNSDYSTTVIYKIYCKDENIKDVYVGHTINFTQRKYSHVKACNNLNNSIRIYKTIRANGGWENWNMVEIATYCCKDLTEARIKENEHYNELQASLNSSQPYVNREVNKKINKVIKKYSCSICNLEFINFEEYNCHIEECKKNITDIINELNVKDDINKITDNIREIKNNLKEINDFNNIQNIEENNVNFNCILCNYSTNKKANYDRHILSSKHETNKYIINNIKTNSIKIASTEENISNVNLIKKYNCSICNKNFNNSNSLWKHNSRKHNNNNDKINKLKKDVINLTNIVNHLTKNKKK